MTTQPPEQERRAAPSAGAVLLWCVLAGGLVAVILLVEPPKGRGLEFWNPTGALRLLADLILFYCIFMIPAFGLRRERPAAVTLLSGAVVLYTGILGLVMVNYLAGYARMMPRVVGFIFLVVSGTTAWAFVLERRRALYYSVAAFVMLGLPVVGFFCEELLRVEARWPDFLSPFTAWRMVLAAEGTRLIAWAVFSILTVSGLLALLIKVRREGA